MEDVNISKNSLFKEKSNKNKAHSFAYGLYLIIDAVEGNDLENTLRKAILLRESDEINASIDLIKNAQKNIIDNRLFYEQSINFKEKQDYEKAFLEIKKIKNINTNMCYLDMYNFLKKSIEF